MLVFRGREERADNQLNQINVVDSGIWTQATLAEGVLLALRQPCLFYVNTIYTQRNHIVKQQTVMILILLLQWAVFS